MRCSLDRSQKCHNLIACLHVSEDHQRFIRDAVRVVRAGGVIAYPTETTYGFGCDPRNAKAMKKLFELKGRDASKQVLWIASDIHQAEKVVKMNTHAKKISKKYWPGPLTMILPPRRGLGDVGIRVTSSAFARALVKQFGYPMTSTSANVSGESPLQSGRAIARRFAAQKIQPDFICDVGYLRKRKPSTIIRVTDDGQIEVLRHGSIKL